MSSSEKPNSLAIPAAATAFLIWGLLPIYWKQFQHIDPLVVVCHRVLWSLVFLVGLFVYQRQQRELLKKLSDRKLWISCLPAALLIATNWLIFIWSVQNNHVVDTSLGYFLTPLCNVLLAIVFVGESVNRLQTWALVVAGAGILYSCKDIAYFPWIALSLAITFALYSLAKKQTRLAAGLALVFETAILCPLALMWLGVGTELKVQQLNYVDWFWLISSGPMTTIPLFLFSYAAQRTSLVNIGMLQYIGPTIGLLVGWLMYGEQMTTTRWVSFGLVWISLAIYTFDMLRKRKAIRSLPGTEEIVAKKHANSKIASGKREALSGSGTR